MSWPQEFIVAKYRIKAGELSWPLSVAYPKAILKCLAQRDAAGQVLLDDAWIRVVREQIVRMPVKLSALLGVIELPFGKVVSMKPGDVFRVSIFDGRHPVMIGGRRQWDAQAGVAGNNHAIKIIAGGHNAS